MNDLLNPANGVIERIVACEIHGRSSILKIK
jgi:hypothetical protein